MKANRNITNNGAFRTHDAISPEEILAAGGATAYGLKAGKNNKELIQALTETPTAEPFTKQEWDNLISQLEKDK